MKLQSDVREKRSFCLRCSARDERREVCEVRRSVRREERFETLPSTATWTIDFRNNNRENYKLAIS